jgi:hypothetical protein
LIEATCLLVALAMPAPQWLDDYDKAIERAVHEHKDLFIYFRSNDAWDQVLDEPGVQQRLRRYVCLRVDTSYQYNGRRLLSYPAFADMLDQPGWVILSLQDKRRSTFGYPISVHPFVTSRYPWVPAYGPDQLQVILDLPPATLAQRSLIYAVRVHPERPQSAHGEPHAAFLGHAESHSARQASTQYLHHADFGVVLPKLEEQVGRELTSPFEVVVESGLLPERSHVLEAAYASVDIWRHSPPHWYAVSRAHRYWGYGLVRSPSGSWFATGFFAD